jgi:branched-chain amino acid aminotransferase
MSEMQYFVNGVVTSAEEARVSVLDHGFTVADGVFETLLISNGAVFALDRHLVRLANSAHGLGIICPDSSVVAEAVRQTLAANSFINHGRLRITVTSGNGPLGSDRGGAQPTLVVTLAKTPRWPETTSAVLIPWIKNERSPLVGLKTTSYAENVMALELAHNLGFSEALMCDSQGRLSEGTGSNIFMIRDGELITPDVHTGLLKGITRDLVLECAHTLGLKVSFADTAASQLATISEAFLTSSTRNVHPITELGTCDSSGKLEVTHELQVGPITQRLSEALQRILESDINP